MSTFYNEKVQLHTLDDLRDYLNHYAKPRFIIGSTFHNTYIPDENDWAGMSSMISMQLGYEKKGWDRGPHFFVAKGTRYKKNDGIWAMTPPNLPGIHAGVCNGDNYPLIYGRFGWELVGNFQDRLPTDDQLDLLTSGIAEAHKWLGIGAEINAHRDCMPGRTCPGDEFYSIKSKVIRLVESKMVDSDVWDLWGDDFPLPKEQRTFGIPSAWVVNMSGPQSGRLGKSVAHPYYSGDGNVVQLFENGIIIYRNSVNKSRVILYKDFRVP